MRESGEVIPPRVIATDLDGTLLRSDGTISDRTRAALDLAAGHGAHLVAVTARPIRWLDRLVPQLGTRFHVIASNGAACYDLSARSVYDVLPFPAGTLPEVVGVVRRELPTASLAIETPGGLARETVYQLSPSDPDHSDPGRRIGEIGELVAGLDGEAVLKIVAAERGRVSAEMFTELHPALGGLAHLTYSTNRGLLELGPPNVTKASTLAAWCTARGIRAHEVAAFGEMPNDLPMLAWAGASYAVANANEDVRAAAGNVTSSHDEDGVAAVIEKLFAA